jgi:Delta3,5-Delta2,4-dienoyl-CoA isomerase
MPVTTKLVDNILTVTLNEPKANQMSNEFFVEIKSIFENVKQDSQVHVVVIKSGIEKFFSAGLDLKTVQFDVFGEKDPARDAIGFLTRPLLSNWQQAFTAIEECKKVVICLINGLAIGGAIDLMTACDLRFCSRDAVFSVREVDVGLAADLGTLQRLPKVVGNQSWVRDVCCTARNFGSDEALQFGLVSKVYGSYQELHKEGMNFAATIAAKSPVAVLGTKEMLLHSRDRPVEDGLKFAQVWNSIMLQCQDPLEAGRAIMMKQVPKFSKL